SLSVAEAVERVEELRDLYRNDPRVRELLDYAVALEGLARHTSVHAAGVVIAPGPLDEYVPILTAPTRGAGGAGGGTGGGSAGGAAASAVAAGNFEAATGGAGGAGGAAAGVELAVITQYDMVSLEQAGMLKFDFLGLKTLTVIHDASEGIRERHGIAIDWDDIGL
ncbi:MAG: hypothetical protein HYY94_03895, partial [Gemmatimonadetes bacterium]|nr:hypothetical protein [Gemmatimonadota bacterium]